MQAELNVRLCAKLTEYCLQNASLVQVAQWAMTTHIALWIKNLLIDIGQQTDLTQSGNTDFGSSCTMLSARLTTRYNPIDQEFVIGQGANWPHSWPYWLRVKLHNAFWPLQGWYSILPSWPPDCYWSKQRLTPVDLADPGQNSNGQSYKYLFFCVLSKNVDMIWLIRLIELN